MKNNLTEGGPLLIEDLDLSGIGLYLDKQKQELGGEETDWFLTSYTSLGRPLWGKHSDKGKKWNIYG